MDSKDNHDSTPQGDKQNDAQVPHAEAASTSKPVTPEGKDTTPERTVRREGTRPAREEPVKSSGNTTTLLVAALLIALGLAAGAIVFAINQHRNNTTVATAPTPALAPTQAPLATPVISGGSVAAVVNGQSIPTSTYRTYLNFSVHRSAGSRVSKQALAKQAMNQVIWDALVGQYARAHHLAVSNAEMQAQIARFKAQQGSPARFQQFLAQSGLTTEGFTLLFKSSLLEQRVAPHVATLPGANVRHILIGLSIPGKPKRTDAKAKALAQQVFAQLQHGGNFAVLAKKYSDDTSSGVKGGDLGQVYPHEMVPPFEKAVFSLPLHHPSLVHTQFGYHIVEVLSRVKAATAPKDVASQQAYQRALAPAFNAWLTQETKKASVKRLVTVT